VTIACAPAFWMTDMNWSNLTACVLPLMTSVLAFQSY
jgi:hypothetical protein